jgi:hypothetical protein
MDYNLNIASLTETALLHVPFPRRVQLRFDGSHP